MNNEKNIKILRASAGSGKTFRLTMNYIYLLLVEDENDKPYRHILAVTFTNKATAEMKNRILKELNILATEPRKSGYYNVFMDKNSSDTPECVTFLDGRIGSEKELKRRAENALFSILHDYSAFAVSTIDKFFQQTLRAFAREIGQFSSYQVELDKDALVTESVDRILDSLSEDTQEDRERLDWLAASVMAKLEQGGRVNVEYSLRDIASRVKQDAYRQAVEKYSVDVDKACSKANLETLRKTCVRIIRSFNATLAAQAQSALDIMLGYGISPSDTVRGFMSKPLYGWQELDGKSSSKKLETACPPSESAVAKFLNPKDWFPKKNRKLGELIMDDDAFNRTVSGLIGSFYEIAARDGEDCEPVRYANGYSSAYKVYNTAFALLGQIYELGLTTDIHKAFDELLREKNLIYIEDTNTILKRIIDGSDAPFIYEKLGVRYEHFMLDEFQDTSVVQWQNFVPLLKESVANSKSSLIVGDVKQSIYRWRGSDWRLLDSEVKEVFGDDADDTESLQDNWRSYRNVVYFNNSFFRYASSALDILYRVGYAAKDGLPKISGEDGIYSDVAQVPKKNEKGGVRSVFCNDKDEEVAMVLATVREALANGMSPGDIAVLVRSNANGKLVAKALIDGGVPVVSDESLAVKSSVFVRRLTALLAFVNDPEDKINGYLSGNLNVALPSGYHSLTDLCECLIRELSKTMDSGNEVAYIQAFMDDVADWSSKNGNSLSGYLEHWETYDKSIVSPEESTSVRVMTIHKSKGLEFPCVILPFVDSIPFAAGESVWLRPDIEGTELEGVADGVYHCDMCSGAEATLYADEYHDSVFKSYVDNLNVLYVAFTRAGKYLHLISRRPSANFIDKLKVMRSDAGADDSYVDYTTACSNMGQLLYVYMSGPLGTGRKLESGDVWEQTESWTVPSDFLSEGEFPEKNPAKDTEPTVFQVGEMYDGNADCKEVMIRDIGWRMTYPSFPLGERLSLSSSASSVPLVDENESGCADDFFGTGGVAYDASKRQRGIVLHEILAGVRRPEDLRNSVSKALAKGLVDAAEAESVMKLLKDRIEERMSDPRTAGWFDSSMAVVRNERALITVDGENKRPDRVVTDHAGKVVIVDYKFADREPKVEKKYLRQISEYRDFYLKLGYKTVEAALWYLPLDKPGSEVVFL